MVVLTFVQLVRNIVKGFQLFALERLDGVVGLSNIVLGGHVRRPLSSHISLTWGIGRYIVMLACALAELDVISIFEHALCAPGQHFGDHIPIEADLSDALKDDPVLLCTVLNLLAPLSNLLLQFFNQWMTSSVLYFMVDLGGLHLVQTVVEGESALGWALSEAVLAREKVTHLGTWRAQFRLWGGEPCSIRGVFCQFMSRHLHLWAEGFWVVVLWFSKVV